uniref:sulfatase-like hydrolase/transferase n=1 Tax=Algisphaera agarilytica TaxID=1385975 RepID=UPI0036F42D27
MDGHVVTEFCNHLQNAGKNYETLAGKTAQGVDPDKPLFSHLSFHWPHTPVLPPQEYRNLFKDLPYDLPEFSTDELSRFPPQLVTLYNECKTDGLKDEEKLQAVRDYYAFCAYGDALIGRAVEEFKTYCEKQGREYLIVFTVGDNGWHLGEQGIMAKFGPWRQSLHNAAIVVSSDPDTYPAGQVCHDMVEFVDFAPTLLTGAGIDVDTPEYDHLDGYDLHRTLDGNAPKRDYVLGELNVVCGHRAFLRTDDFAFSMRTRDMWDQGRAPDLNHDVTWALTCDRPKADLALYDLRVDPLERNNVAEDHAYRGLADWFREKLGTIVLGDGRIECDWRKPNSYSLSNFAGGAHDHQLNIPEELIP